MGDIQGKESGIMDDIQKTSDIKIKLLTDIIINLFKIIDRLNLIGSKTKNSQEFLEIKDAIQKLKEIN
jgi:hypothetical protein